MAGKEREPVDRPGPVRAGEELDVAALRTYLAEHLADALADTWADSLPEALGGEGGTGGRLTTEALAGLEVAQFPSGYSNLTYSVRLPVPAGTAGTAGLMGSSAEATTPGPLELVLRRPPFGSDVRGAHDMSREHRILSRLAGVYPKAPRPVLFCDDPSVLGAPFYLMERVRGVILRGGSADLGLDATGRRRLTEAFADALAELHAVDLEAAGLGDLGHPEGYVERQVRGWTERYLAAKTDEVPEVERAAAWLAEHLPGPSGDSGAARAALIHNDFKLDNLVLAPPAADGDDAGSGDGADPDAGPRIVAVLDWEMATVGDPLMDLGSSLAYWVAPGDPVALRHAAVPRLTAEPGSLSRGELVARYAETSGREIADPVPYFVYGQLKLAGIIQQIYARYRRGATSDPRFAHLLPLIRACGEAAEHAIERGRIDRLTS